MRTTLSNKEKLTLISNLATMLSAGIPILEAVEALLEESKGNMQKVLLLLKRSLNEGKPISQALSEMPKVFDPVTLNLIQASEEAGTLETTLKDLTKNIKKQIAFNDRLRGSLTYPLFVMVVFVMVLVVILAFVVPRIAKVFGGLRVELPPATQFMITLSNGLLTYWPYIIAGFVLLLLGIGILFRAKKQFFINALLGLPGLSSLGRHIDLTRFTHSMGQLLKAGIPVAEALELSERTVVKKDIIAAVRATHEGVLAGKPISDGLHKNKKVIPSLMSRSIETAERSGTLETAMEELSEYFEEQVDRSLKMVTTLIEPIMLVFIGLLVGGMMLAVIAPIYSLITQIKA